MEFLIWTLHVGVAAGVIGLVLLQHGKGADMGAAFGSGASGSLFGASGSANFLSRATGALATLFFLTSLGLTYFSTQKQGPEIKPAAVPVQSVAPAAPELPASPMLPAQDAGSKAGEIPK